MVCVHSVFTFCLYDFLYSYTKCVLCFVYIPFSPNMKTKSPGISRVPYTYSQNNGFKLKTVFIFLNRGNTSMIRLSMHILFLTIRWAVTIIFSRGSFLQIIRKCFCWIYCLNLLLFVDLTKNPCPPLSWSDYDCNRAYIWLTGQSIETRDIEFIMSVYDRREN